MAGTNGTIDGATSLSQRLLTLPEAAHYLGCTLWSVRELIWKGDLPYTRFGKRFQVDRRDLDELVDREKRCQRGNPSTGHMTPNRRGVAKFSDAKAAHTLSLNDKYEDQPSVRKGKKQQAKLGVL